MFPGLQFRFQRETEEAIQYCERLLMDGSGVDDFSRWISAERRKSTEFSCHEAWDSPQIVVICQTCVIGKTGGICVPCYLNGRHEGHDVLLEISDSGSCDCGNSICWDPKGFCTKHKGPPANPHLIDLSPERTEMVADIVRNALLALVPLAVLPSNQIKIITDFLSDLVSIGDAYRRIVSLVITDDYDLPCLLLNWPKFTCQNAKYIYDLLNKLIDDAVFISRFTIHFCDAFLNLVSVFANNSQNDVVDETYDDFFCFDSFSNGNESKRTPETILIDISFFTWNYVSSHPELFEPNNIPDLISRFITLFCSLFAYNVEHLIVKSPYTKTLFECLDILISSDHFLKLLESPDKQDILISILESLSLIEACPSIEVKFGYFTKNRRFASNKHNKIYYASLGFNYIYELLDPVSTINVSSKIFLSQLFSFCFFNVLRDLVDNIKPMQVTCSQSNLNDSYFYSPSIWHRSIFTNGVCLGCFLPLHFLTFKHFVTHTSLDNPEDEWNAFSREQNLTPDMLLYITTVLPIRTCAAVNYHDLGLTVTNWAFNNDYSSDISVQGRWAAAVCAASLSTNPDGIMSMFIHTFGLVDSDKSQLFNTMNSFVNHTSNNESISPGIKYFCFFHFISTLIVDDSIFCRNKQDILKRKVIAFLQEGPKSMYDIFDYIGDVEKLSDLKNILDEVAMRKKRHDIDISDDPRGRFGVDSQLKNKTLNSYIMSSDKLDNDSLLQEVRQNIVDSYKKKSNIRKNIKNKISEPKFSNLGSSKKMKGKQDSMNSTMFLLKKQYKSCIPLSIWISPQEVMLAISFHYEDVQFNMDLSPIKPSPHYPKGFNPSKILFTPSFYALCFIVLSELELEKGFHSIIVLLDLLLYMNKICNEPLVSPKEHFPTVKVKNFNQLCHALPTKFRIFLRTNISFGPYNQQIHISNSNSNFGVHMGTGSTNMLELIKNLGPIGNSFLTQLNQQNQQNQTKITDKKKAQINELRKKEIIHMFKSNINTYLPTMLSDQNNICSICHRPIKNIENINGFLYSFKMPSGRITKRFAISYHLFHSKCIGGPNCLRLTDPDTVFQYFDKNILNIIQCISDEIEIIEIRQIRNPFVFNDYGPELLIKHLFNTIVKITSTAANNKRGNSVSSNINNINSLYLKTNFVTALISELFLHYINNNLNFLQNVQIPFDTFLKFIETILAKNEFKITFSGLRRCLIIAHYIAHLPNINLKNNCSKSEKLLDDVNEIANFFHVPIESISDFQTISNIDLSNSKTNYINQSVKWLDEFCYYPFIKLPQNFLEFSVDPYNYQILSNDDNIQYLCLLSGKCMNEESLSSYLELVHCSLFLVLSGNMAGCLKLIVKCRTIIERIVDSPYITMFGDEKYGFEDGQMLWKNEDRLWRLCDEFLSGALLFHRQS